MDASKIRTEALTALNAAESQLAGGDRRARRAARDALCGLLRPGIVARIRAETRPMPRHRGRRAGTSSADRPNSLTFLKKKTTSNAT